MKQLLHLAQTFLAIMQSASPTEKEALAELVNAFLAHAGLKVVALHEIKEPTNG